MKIKLKLFFLPLVFMSCTPLLLGEDPSNSSQEIFEQFWKGVDETWPEFATKKVNWDSLHQVYRPQVDTAKTDNSLYLILRGLLYNLKDQHTNIYAADGSVISYSFRSASNFYGYSWISSHYLPGARANGVIGYGKLNADIGYIYILDFAHTSNLYDIIDAILQEFKDLKGIIIDVRNNSGGNSSNSLKIASRFTNQSKTYLYSRFRTGSSRTEMGDFVTESISPGGSMQYLGKVAVLTNRTSFSATEDFVLMMKSYATVIQVGDNTGGGSGSRPINKELPRGWSYRVSTKLVCGLDKIPISNGIVPDIKSSVTRIDSLKGKDAIIEAAIAALNKP